MMSVRPKLFENKSPAHHLLIFTLGCGIDQIFMISKYVYFIAKYNSTGFLETFHYRDKFLLGRSVVMLCLA